MGLVISHDRHHLHSYYVIRNSELLTGFTDHELELIALVARYHRKSTPKARHPEYASLHEADQRVVEILSGMLRIAAGLDRTRCGAVSRLRVEGGENGEPLRILVETAPGADADLELYSARNRKDLLEDALGVTVEIEASPRAAPGGVGRRRRIAHNEDGGGARSRATPIPLMSERLTRACSPRRAPSRAG